MQRSWWGNGWRLTLAAACAVVWCAMASCGSREAEAGAGPVIVTSIPPHAWLVRQIVGPTAHVHCMLSPGDSEETFQPSDGTITRATRGVVYYSAGVPFERGRWFTSLTSGSDIDVVSLLEGVSMLKMDAHHHHDHDHDEVDDHDEHDQSVDPHTWTSIDNLRVQANHIADDLSQRFPEHRETYAANLATVIAELDALDADIADMLRKHRGRVMLVYHPTWGYFAQQYGLRQIAIESEGKSPSDRELSEIQAMAKREGVRYIFVQPQVAQQSVERIAEALGGGVVMIDPLSDNVPGNMRRVARAIRDALDQTPLPGQSHDAEHDHEH